MAKKKIKGKEQNDSTQHKKFKKAPSGDAGLITKTILRIVNKDKEKNDSIK